MTKEELIEYLRSNIKVQVIVDNVRNSYDKAVTVQLYLEDELISWSSDTIPS